MRYARVTIAAVALILLGLLAGGGPSNAAPLQSSIVAPVMDMGTHCLLGGIANRGFIPVAATAPSIKGGERYRMYSLQGFLGIGTGTRAESLGVPCEDEMGVEVTPDYLEQEAIGIGGTWAAMPRVPRAMSTNQKVYNDATRALLRAGGIANPQVHVRQVLRIDLEGDGTEEVLVSATYFANDPVGPASPTGGPSPDAEAGDYSIVYMRKVVRGKVETTLLESNIYPQRGEFVAPVEYKVRGILDVNGDGTMEVVVYGRYYEGHWSTVYEVKGTQVEEVLVCGCGA